MIHLFAERNTIELVEGGPWKRSQMPLVCGRLPSCASDRCPRPRDRARTRAAWDCRRTNCRSQLDIVLLEERQHTVIEQIGRRDRRLAAWSLATVSPWSRRAVDICQLDTYQPELANRGLANRRRRRRRLLARQIGGGGSAQHGQGCSRYG